MINAARTGSGSPAGEEWGRLYSGELCSREGEFLNLQHPGLNAQKGFDLCCDVRTNFPNGRCDMSCWPSKKRVDNTETPQTSSVCAAMFTN